MVARRSSSSLQAAVRLAPLLAVPGLAGASSLPSSDTAPALPVFESDDSVVVSAVDNDVFAAGDSVVLEGAIGDNAFLAGQTVRVEHAIGGDLFAAADSLRIDAPVHGDVYAAGRSVVLGPEGRIDGHLHVGGAEVTLAGPVAGGVRAGTGRLKVAAPISGDVELDAGELVFDAGGHIGGDLTYTTPAASPDAAGHVGGTVVWIESEEHDHGGFGEEPSAGGAMAMWSLWTGWRIMGQLIVGAVLLMLGGSRVAGFARTLQEHPSRSLGLGLVGLVFLPIASLIACALVVPLPLGFLGLLAFAAMLYLGQLIVAQAVGERLVRRFRPELNGTPLLYLLAGAVPLAILTGLPWVGGLVGFLVTVLGAGAVAVRLREAARA